MKNVLLSIIALLSGVAAFAQINFSDISFKDALERAKKEKKLIFVDIYTSWCGHCKEMAKSVFTLNDVGEFFNKNFISVKYDAEKSDDGKKIARDYIVTGYPTMLFINGEGRLVNRVLGYKTGKNLIADGEKALSGLKNLPKLKKLEATYKKGGKKVNKAFLSKYYTALKESGAECSDVVIEYFKVLRDDEVIFPENLTMLVDMVGYNQEVMVKLMRALHVSSGSAGVHPQSVAQLGAVCGSLISRGIDEAMAKNDSLRFEETLTMRDALISVKGNEESVAKAILGNRGSVYLPEEALRLKFYADNNHNSRFVPMMKSYTTKYILSSRELLKNIEKTFIPEMQKAIKEAEKAGNAMKVQELIQGIQMMETEVKINLFFISNLLLGYIDKYEELTNEEKNDAFNKKIVTWYHELHKIFPSVQTAPFIAERVAKKGNKTIAIHILKESLAKGKVAYGVQQGAAEAAEALLKKLEGK